MITPENALCYDLKVIPLKDGMIDISWSLDTNTLKELLEIEDINKILNLHENIDFQLEIDSKDTFDTINLKQFNFSSIDETNKYIGNIVFSCIIDFNKNQFEETTYYLRIKISSDPKNCQVLKGSTLFNETIQIDDIWSNTLQFNIPKNYTKDIIDIMYATVADFNAYNKEVSSANFYYIFQAFADTLNKEFGFVIDTKNANFLNKSLPNFLNKTFGTLFKFTDVENISMEEYRRVLQNLSIAYQNGGAWNYIKEVLKYFVGYTPDLITFKNFYPWILRTRKQLLGSDYVVNNIELEDPINYAQKDPTEFSDRNYYNPESGYYTFKTDYEQPNDNNKILLLRQNFKTFTFVVKTDNFFNRNIDTNKIKSILNILKSVYTKYILNIEEQMEVADVLDALLVETNVALFASDDEYISF